MYHHIQEDRENGHFRLQEACPSAGFLDRHYFPEHVKLELRANFRGEQNVHYKSFELRLSSTMQRSMRLHAARRATTTFKAIIITIFIVASDHKYRDRISQ